MQVKYEWKRFFSKRGDEEPVLVEDAYLYNPENGDGYVNKHVVSLEDVESIPCIVILGEPGLGKSTALEDEEIRLKTTNNLDMLAPILKRMEEFSDEGELRRKVFESQEWVDWKEGDKILPLLLDSLDEVRIHHVKTASSVLTEGFRDVDKSRLRVRICCRTGDWPSYFTSDLIGLWGKHNFDVYRILPLREQDIREAIEKNQVKAEDFFLEIKNKEVQPFAAKPITLEFLIDEFKKNGALPKYQWDIYEKLCLKLCDEPNPRHRETPSIKDTYKLDKFERIQVASKIAAVMMLCNRNSISQENENNDVESVLTLKQLTTGQKRCGYISKDDLRETLRISIFTSRQANSFIFGHQSYIEFLAARYLCEECHLPFRRLKRILLTGNNGLRKVVPQLRELAAWCSNLNIKLKKWMIKHDPIAMIFSDLSVLTDQEKYSLVENLLFELDKLEFFDPSLLWSHGRKLKHPKIGEQLKDYIEDINKSHHVRELAIDIARQCRVDGLGDLLIDMITNSCESSRIRSHACYALENIGTEEQKRSLKGTLCDTEETIDDELKGSLLRILWPDFLSVDELLDMLSLRQDPDTVGSYDMFIHDLEDRIETNNIPKVLQKFSNFIVPRNMSGYSFERMLDKIFLRALNSLETNNMKTSIAKYMLLRYELDHKFISQGTEKGFRKIIKSNVDARKELVKELLKVGLPEGDKRWILVWCVGRCIYFEDFFWLLDIVDNYPVKIKIILMDHAYSYLTQYEGVCVTSEHVERFLEKLEQCEDEIKEDFKLLKGVSLDSKEAKQQRKLALERKKYEKEEAERKKAQPKPEDIIEQNLAKAMNGELSAWINLSIAICSEGDHITNDYIQKHFLSESQRWRNLDETIKQSVSEASHKFLINNPPKDHGWLSTNSRSRYIWSGQIALGLSGSSQKILNALPEDILMAWIPTIIGFWGTPDEGFKRTIEHSYKKCPETFIEYLNIRLDFENENNSYSEIITYLDGILDEKLERYLFGKLKEKRCKSNMFKRLCDLLIKTQPNGFVEFILLKVSPPWSDIEAEKEISAIAFQLVLCNWNLKYWEKIRMCLSEVPEICQKALYNFSYHYRHHETDILLSLEPWQLGELYVWLRDYRNKKKGTVSTRAESMEDYSYLTLDNYMINTLVKSATPESMNALKYIHKHLNDEHKEYFKYYLNQAEEEKHRKFWQQNTPEEVIQLQYTQKRRQFKMRLLMLFLIICAVDIFIAVFVLGKVKLNQWPTKLWGIRSFFVWINIIIIGLWYSLLKAEEKQWFKHIKNKFTGWKS